MVSTRVTAPHSACATVVRVTSDPHSLAESRLSRHEQTAPGQRSLHEVLHARIDPGTVLMPPVDPLEPAAYRIMISAGAHLELPVRTRPLRQGHCHANVAQLYVTGEVSGVCSGFCLDSGVWRQHAWALEAGEIVETTSGRDAYFGVELHPTGAALFAFCELGSDLHMLECSPGYLRAATELREVLRHHPASEASVWDFLERSGLYRTPSPG